MTRKLPHVGQIEQNDEQKEQKRTYEREQDRPNEPELVPVPHATTPYWRRELHYLDEYRSTQDLPEECDIVIIGAGMSGVSTAYHLLNLCGDTHTPPSITLLEARQVCSGATGRNGGHIKSKVSSILSMKRQFGTEAAEEFVAFVEELIYHVKEVVEREQLDCEFELRRTYDVFLDAEDAEQTTKAFFNSLHRREKWTRQVDFVPGERAEQVTSIKGAKAAFSGPACSLWPYKFVTELLDRIIDRINLQTNTTVHRVCEDEASGLQLVTTPRGVIRAKKVIFASNGYTAGICPVYKEKIVPVRITASHLSPEIPVSPHLSHTYNIAYSSSEVDYLNPRPDGSIVVGGGKARYKQQKNLWYKNWDDSTLLPGVEVHFDGLMQKHFKGWEDSGCRLEQLWTGIIGYTADGMPHIGEVPGRKGKQYMIAGFNGGGMSVIFSAALGLAKMVKDGVSFRECGLPTIFEPTAKRLREEVKDPEGRD